MAPGKLYDSLTDEQKAKAREAKTREEGHELTDAELEAIAGGRTCNKLNVLGR